MEEYIFDKNRKRVKLCPCGKKNKDGKFVPFIGHDKFGYCFGCGKSFKPASDDGWKRVPQPLTPKSPMQVRTSIIPHEKCINYLRQRKCRIEDNNFVKYLHSLFEHELVEQVCHEYGLTALKSGAVVFWLIDFSGQVRSGKIMHFDEMGKRKKTVKIFWVHSEMKNCGTLDKSFEISQCFFGEHLLQKYPSKPVAIVEGQSTAIFMTALSKLKKFKDFIWLSTGGKYGVKWDTSDVQKILTGRKVILLPDAGAYTDWNCKVAKLSNNGLDINISGFLENLYEKGQCPKNWDLRDFYENQLLKVLPEKESKNE